NQFGIATAEAVLGSAPGVNVFAASAGGMRTTFTVTGIAQPVISDNGVVNSASYQLGPGIAPGSYISIFGTGLSMVAASASAATPRLPGGIRGVTVSFDVPEAKLSLPGHLVAVNPQQVNVQVPWELKGQTSVRMKVSIEGVSGLVSTVPVADDSPGLYSYTSSG